MPAPAQTRISGPCRRCSAVMPTEASRCPTCGASAVSERHPAAGGTASAMAKQLGDFAIAGELGRGGMGVVFEANDGRLKRRVALKALKARFRDDQRARLRFLDEARITGQLEHPGIVPVYALGEDGGDAYFCMKLITGRTLARLIELWHQGEAEVRGDWPLARLVEVFERVVETVAFAHSRRVIHRDLKPANVMIGEHGEVWVLDWGLARTISAGDGDDPPSSKRVLSVRDELADGLTVQGRAVGTPNYMAPEQARGDALDERSDVFALGAVLFELLAGGPPIGGRTVSATLAAAAAGRHLPLRASAAGRAAPRGLAAIALRCLQPDPARRYPSAAALLADLRAWRADRPLAALPETPWRRLRRFARRHGVGVAASAVLVIVVLGCAALVQRRVASGERAALEAQLTAQRESNRAERAELARARDRAAAAAAAERRLAADGPYARGMDLLLRGQQPSEAVAELQRAVAADPGFAEAQGALGEALRQAGRPAQAGEAFLAADEAARTAGADGSLPALLAAGFAFDEAGADERASAVFARAARAGGAAGGEPLALVAQAMLLDRQGDAPGAVVLAERVVAAAPYLWEGHYARGCELLGLEIDGIAPRAPTIGIAIDELRTAQAMVPRQAQIIANLAIALMESHREGDAREAARLIDQAVALAPDNGNRYVDRAHFRLRYGGDVAADLARARAFGADEGATLTIEMHVAAHRGDNQGAERIAQRLLALRPAWTGDVLWHLLLSIRLGRAEQVAEQVDAFAAAHPRMPDAFLLRAMVADARGDRAAFSEAIGQGLRLAPTNGSLYELLGATALHQGEHARALAALDQELVLHPGLANVELMRIAALVGLQRVTEARSAADAFASAHPELIDDARRIRETVERGAASATAPTADAAVAPAAAATAVPDLFAPEAESPPADRAPGAAPAPR